MAARRLDLPADLPGERVRRVVLEHVLDIEQGVVVTPSRQISDGPANVPEVDQQRMAVANCLGEVLDGPGRLALR